MKLDLTPEEIIAVKFAVQSDKELLSAGEDPHNELPVLAAILSKIAKLLD